MAWEIDLTEVTLFLEKRETTPTGKGDSYFLHLNAGICM